MLKFHIISKGKQFTGGQDKTFRTLSGFLNQYVDFQKIYIIAKKSNKKNKNCFRYEPVYCPALLYQHMLFSEYNILTEHQTTHTYIYTTSM